MADLNNMNDGASESGGLSYQLEQADRLLQGDTPVGGYPGIGTTDNGGDVSGTTILDPGLGTDGSSLFNDGEKPYDASGFDSMRGTSGLDNIHGEILADESMYASQGSLPMPVVPESAEPLLQPDEH